MIPGEMKPGRGAAPGSRESAHPANEHSVLGERGPPLVSKTRSLQSRVSSIMACGLMIIIGAGMLTWYYSNAISRQSRAKRNAQTAASHRAQGEMPLPSLEGFNSLRMSADRRQTPSDRTAEHEPGSLRSAASTMDAATPSATVPPELPLTVSQSNWANMGSQRAPYPRAMRKSAAQVTRERLLSGAAFARESGSRPAITNGAAAFRDGGDVSGSNALIAGDDKTVEADSFGGGISALLRPTALASARAQILPTRRFLLAKGAFIDCTLETAIDSTLPGMTTCITATDTFSADGTVVLLERGTKLIGETRGQVQQGAARVFVLWTEARTPTGIVVPLDSPGTDELGRSGLPGEVNRHFWDRFGAAILISTLDGAVQAAVQAASRGGGPIIYNPSNSATVVTDVLKSTVNIPPTVSKHNGDRIEVFVARDLDFRPVYELRSIATAR